MCAQRRKPPPKASSIEDEPVRIQKFLAAAGIASRREIERWIEAGRIVINGKPASLGDRICSADSIKIDGKPLKIKDAVPDYVRVIKYHKPEGEVTTRSDPEGRPTVFEQLPSLKRGRWISVGRLDVNTAGLLLFTNNGALANQLMHPSSEVEREYAVRVYGKPAPDQIENMLNGVELEDGRGNFESIRDAGGQGRNHWYHVVIKEGRNREVRRIWESQGIQVSRLIRVRYGEISLPPGLRKGRWEDLDPVETRQLLKTAGMNPDEYTIWEPKRVVRKKASPYKSGKGRK